MRTNDSANHPDEASTEGHPDCTSTTETDVATVTDQIGPYRLLRLLGEGGMGEVWLAEQKTPIRRTVALKLVKAGMDTKAVVARFESERQALALMDDPKIARVFDAGSTPEGRPYFVMEYVPGLPITEYCDKRRLTIRERLELFVQVCEGVQHAHQKAIIHRDLKPSNVLVVEQAGKAIPKIIDFGLAKALTQRLTDKTMFTEQGVMLGTPEYLSPEQADQREQNIDTRTDVYSLEVILHQLLVGKLPFDLKSLRAEGLEAILGVIREQEPTKPSARARLMGPASAEAAERRKEEPRSLARRLQGELDWIAMKALEKDRARRYGSPAELGADIERHLHNEPVLAHPLSAAYRAMKFVKRHRLAVAAVAFAAVLSLGFAAAMGIQARRIAEERDRANRQAEVAQRVANFMKGMFKVADPSAARGNNITAREILDSASKEIDTGLAKDPEIQAQLMDVMGEVYESLGLYPSAQPLLEHAVELQRRVHGPRNPETLEAADHLALLLFREGHYAEAEKLGRETLNVRRQVLGPEHPETLKSMLHLAITLGEEGRYAEAEKMQRELLDVQRRVLGAEHTDTLETTANLAETVIFEGRYAEAEKMERELLDSERRVLGPEHPDTLSTINDLTVTLRHEGRFAEAENRQRELLDMERRVLGPEHPDTLRTMNHLAGTLADEGHYAEAEKMERELLDIQRRVLGPEHPDTATSVYNLGCLAARQGHRNEALSLLREAVDHGVSVYIDAGIDKDPDLNSLHGDPRFTSLVAYAKEKAATVQKPQ